MLKLKRDDLGNWSFKTPDFDKVSSHKLHYNYLVHKNAREFLINHTEELKRKIKHFIRDNKVENFYVSYNKEFNFIAITYSIERRK